MSQSSRGAVVGRPLPVAAVLLGVVVVLAAGLALSSGAAHTWWSVLALGVVEGVTEFLPISSTGHLLIVANLLHFQDDIGGTFEIFIQLGAILAVCLYYARDLLGQAQRIPTSAATRRFWLSIVIAFLPAAVVGLLTRKWIKQVLFASPTVIAWALIIGGVALIAIEQIRLRTRTTDVEQVSPLQALGVGVAQILSLVPGLSRSASTIVGGMLGGLDRRTATAFSFYLAIPTLGAATVVDLLGSLNSVTASDVPRLVVGTVVAFISAWFSIGWLLRYVARHSFVGFGIYRIIVGGLVLMLVYAGLM